MKTSVVNALAKPNLTPSQVAAQALATASAIRLLEDIRSHVLALETRKANNSLVRLLQNIEAGKIVVSCPAQDV
jgi:hypothetical protein